MLPERAAYPRAEPRDLLRDYYYVIIKKRWLITTVAITVLAASAIYSFFQTPMYKATSLIQIGGSKINLGDDVIVEDARVYYGHLYGTQMQIISSQMLARRVAEELNLLEHRFFTGPLPSLQSSDREKTLKRIQSQIQSMCQVQPVPNTLLMEVGFVTPDPDLAAQLTNTLVDQYILYNTETERGVAQTTASFIRDKIEELQGEILKKENLLRQHSISKQLVIADKKDSIVTQRLHELNRQMTQAETQRASAEAHLVSVRNSKPDALPEVQASTTIRSLKNKLSALEEQYAELSSKFKPDWPEMQRLAAKIEEVRQGLGKEIADEAEKAVAAARISYQEALRKERLLRQSLARESADAQELGQATADYDQIKMELDNQREMLQGLLRRQSDTDIKADLREQQPIKVRIVQRADVPEHPFTPNAPMNLLAGGVIGIFLGIIIALGLNVFDDTICTVEDLRQNVSLPLLGMIPSYVAEQVSLANQPRRLIGPGKRDGGANGSRRPTGKNYYLPTVYDRRPALQENRNILSERFKFLRGSILLSTPGATPKIILVTSPDKGCGKTFVCCNLGLALVQMNKKVLLVDSDLRNPSLHRVFKYRNRSGLTNLLTGQKTLQDGCIVNTEIPNLFLLMAGPKSPTPGELLASSTMAQTLEGCGRHFDFVLLDSAPLLPVFDSHTLTAHSDAVLLVTRSCNTTKRSLKTSLELIEKVNGKVTGVVLNAVDLNDYAQYYYHSHYSYEYGTCPTADGQRSA